MLQGCSARSALKAEIGFTRLMFSFCRFQFGGPQPHNLPCQGRAGEEKEGRRKVEQGREGEQGAATITHPKKSASNSLSYAGIDANCVACYKMHAGDNNQPGCSNRQAGNNNSYSCSCIEEPVGAAYPLIYKSAKRPKIT